MQSKATTVDAYLAELPADRRSAIETVRKVILENLDKDYEEGILYGMIGYFVPHRIYPAGYHCDPKLPLGAIGLASQKNHMSLYLTCNYLDTSHSTWFLSEWKKTGKKLDMGKGCLRFKKVEDLALDVIGESLRRMPVMKYVQAYESALAMRKQPSKPAKKTTKKAVKKAKKAATTATRKKASPRKKSS